MKIRNGFVSNSSSSSFVVAFSKKPKSADDVKKELFNGKNGTVKPYECIDGATYSDISAQVFKDTKHKTRSIGLKTLTKIFEHRYHYFADCRNFHFGGRKLDKDGGSWSEPINRYFGSDKVNTEKLRQIYLEEDRKNKEFYRIRGELSEKSPYKIPIKRENWLKKNKEFQKLQEEFFKRINQQGKNKDLFIKNMATADAKNFLKDNKGKFIFFVRYSDNDGDFATTMEHGNIFRKVPHITISEH